MTRYTQGFFAADAAVKEDRRAGFRMELYTIIENFQPKNDRRLLEKAQELSRPLLKRTVEPENAFFLKRDGSGKVKREEASLSDVSSLRLDRGGQICLDFGNHITGYASLELDFAGSHPDAPAFLRLRFAEMPQELTEDVQDYHGWLSGSWIQEETVHVDELPSILRMPRRYAFRYLMITVLDTSPKYGLVIRHVSCTYESAADDRIVSLCCPRDTMEGRIEKVSLRTLANCMQDVFEDGPKRDRRLWIGDFRLQALANYASFRNMDLVKRCLYLFAGSRFPDGRVSACVFTTPLPEADDTWFFDYSLFFPVILEEYLREKEDPEALEDLYETAMDQITLSLGKCDSDGLVGEEAAATVFADWCDGLDKRACAQAVLIYATDYALALARRKNDTLQADLLEKEIQRLKESARKHFWSEEEKCFVSGGQKSMASQVWMVLAHVPDAKEARTLMETSSRFEEPYRMMTPYMHHYYTAALMDCGLKEMAMDHIRAYWGGMVLAGADTFWETWDPKDPGSSPYGGTIVNSYCHAWSCTPMIWLRKHCIDS